MADRIELTGLEVFAHHGVLDYEREQGQPFIVDAVCWLDCSSAVVTDDLQDTLDYAHLAQVIYDTVAGTPRNLIETVAGQAADTVMATFSQLYAVEVTIHKPQAPIPLRFKDVAVVARRSAKTGVRR